jgi:hypothetical protein
MRLTSSFIYSWVWDTRWSCVVSFALRPFYSALHGADRSLGGSQRRARLARIQKNSCSYVIQPEDFTITDAKAHKRWFKVLRNKIGQIWHSEGRASWYIMKANEMHYSTREIQMKTINIFYLIIYWIQKVHVVLLASAGVIILTTLADASRTRMIHTYCVYTVLRYSWWWTADMSETCRVLYQNKFEK